MKSVVKKPSFKMPKIRKGNDFTPVPNNHIEQESDDSIVKKFFPDYMVYLLISAPIILFILTILWIILN